MAAKTRQQKMEEQFATMFAGMEPIEPEAAAEPPKKRGRPAKKPTTAAEQTAQKPAEATKKTTAKKSTAKRSEAVSGDSTKPQRKSDGKAAFSVWMTKATADEVKQYSEISGAKMTDICEAALTEYLKNHALTAKQKAEYKKRLQERINDI